MVCEELKPSLLRIVLVELKLSFFDNAWKLLVNHVAQLLGERGRSRVGIWASLLY